jgi:hypothetical protein
MYRNPTFPIRILEPMNQPRPYSKFLFALEFVSVIVLRISGQTCRGERLFRWPKICSSFVRFQVLFTGYLKRSSYLGTRTYPAELIMAPKTSGSERRAWPRRRRLLRVLVLPDEAVIDEPYPAWLVDSSPGGLRLAMQDSDIVAGNVLHVKAATAGPDTRWTRVHVRYRRVTNDQVELGCQRLASRGA